MIHGHYFDGRSARPRPAYLSRGDDLQWLVWSMDGEPLQVGDAEISPRLGNTPRVLMLGSGGQFESDDNDAIDALLTRSERHARGGWVDAIERRWRMVAAALLALLFGSWLFVGQGIPLLAGIIANQLPDDVLDMSANAALNQLEQLLHPSRLDSARQAELRRRFAPLLANGNYRVMFFSGGRMGANAFALPDGTLILTDELVAMAANDDELVAVVGHEIGHVAHRHALRQLLQSAAIGTLGLALLGGLKLLLGSFTLFNAPENARLPALLQARPARLHRGRVRAFSRACSRLIKPLVSRSFRHMSSVCMPNDPPV